jgi:hypothetical protein
MVICCDRPQNLVVLQSPVALYFIICTPICYLACRERIFDDVTANNSNEYVTIKVDRHVVLAYT